MSPSLHKIAIYRLRRAKQALREGEALLAAGLHLGAINRLYYAAFYAAKALLATKGLDSSKHSGVIALFQEQFVKTGLIDREAAKALPRAFERRLDTDYEDFASVNRSVVTKLAESVRSFVRVCDAFRRQSGGSS